LDNNSIIVQNLTKRFGSFISVNDISFTVKSGSIFGFLGANGAGKSTTIKMLTGLLNPTSGDALVGGYSIAESPDLVKKNIGYMSQRFSLYDDLTIEENITFFGSVYGLESKKLQQRLSYALSVAQLEGKEKLLTGSLPGGIKQRLALATAVLHQPPIIFLDEPTSGVDPISRRNFWELIHSLSAEGTTVFVTTHYLEEAEYCDNIILLDAGKIIAEGSPTYLKTAYLKNPILSFATNVPHNAMEYLKTKNEVLSISVFGSSLHCTMNLFNEPVYTLSRLLQEADLEFSDMKQIIPSLEDVFIHLLDSGK